MDEKQNELKPTKKQITKTILVVMSLAMFATDVLLFFTKGLLWCLSLKYIALIFLTPLPFCIAFHNEIMEAAYKIDIEKEKAREERKDEDHDTWYHLPMPASSYS